MAINIAVFVPAGIAIGSDNVAFQRNEDDGSIFRGAVSTFIVLGRFIISFVGNGFINEKPYDFYIECISLRAKLINFPDVQSFNDWLMAFWTDEGCAPPSYYLAGYDIKDSKANPVVMLCEKGYPSIVNSDGQQYLYYYHSCGKNEWIDKILLDTVFEDPQSGEKIELQPAMVNFSKFALKMAVSFISFMLDLSAKLNLFCSMNDNVGNNHTICVVTPSGTYEV